MSLLADPMRAAAVVLLASVAALAMALIAEHGFGLKPCVLCIYQRWPYVVAALFAVAALLLRGRWRWLALAGAGAALAVDAGIAGYHVGVEQGWWTGTAACSGLQGTPQTVEELKAQLLATPVVRCDDVAFSLFGVSMAGYNFLYASALCLFTIAVILRAPARGVRP